MHRAESGSGMKNRGGVEREGERPRDRPRERERERERIKINETLYRLLLVLAGKKCYAFSSLI